MVKCVAIGGGPVNHRSGSEAWILMDNEYIPTEYRSDLIIKAINSKKLSITNLHVKENKLVLKEIDTKQTSSYYMSNKEFWEIVKQIGKALGYEMRLIDPILYGVLHLEMKKSKAMAFV